MYLLDRAMPWLAKIAFERFERGQRQRIDEMIRVGSEPDPIGAGPGDVVIYPGGVWSERVVRHAIDARERGARIVPVVHDVIPLSHPQFFSRNFNRRFREWITHIAEVADGFVSVSHATSEQLRMNLNKLGLDGRFGDDSFGVFRLGADIANPSEAVRPDLTQIFTGDSGVYLTVGNLEPRKNHAYILDAFEQHWSSGGAARLLVAGRVGWQCAGLVRRLERSRWNGTRLFWMSDLDDSSLAYAYANARALVTASVIEGFGLPIVESMHHGTPVIAADIPIFREVAGSSAEFVSLDDPKHLVGVVDRCEGDADVLPRIDPARAGVLSWNQSAKQLFEQAIAVTGDSD